MATRRGVFGRSPRPAASLTNTIIAIAREMQQTRDQNIMNAWARGGMFEGKPVTDEMILKHWKTRAAQVDKSDPMYDTYQNAYMEYDYSINESKMRTLYAQGKVSDAAAAAFYTNWAKKVPKNSEFYRVLMRDAAGYLNANKAKNAASASAAKEKAYDLHMQGIQNTKIKAGEYIFDVFKNLATRGLLPGGSDPSFDPMTGDIYNMAPDTVEKMLKMINMANDPKPLKVSASSGGGAITHGVDGGARTAGGSFDANSRVAGGSWDLSKPGASTSSDTVLYHDDMGRPVTGASIVAEMKKIEPGFKGTLTLANIQSYITDQKKGLEEAAAYAEKTGHLTDAQNLRKQLTIVAEKGREVQAWPVEQNYLDSRNRMLTIINDPNASEQDRKDAITAHRAYTLKLSNDPSIKANDVFRNKLIAEANGTSGVASAAEDFTGLNNVQPKDIDIANNALERAENAIKSVDGVNILWATGEYKDNVFYPSPGGSAVGAATKQDIMNNSGGNPTKVIYVEDRSGRFTPVTMLAQDVTTHAFDPVTGAELQGTTNRVVGQVYVGPDGKKLYSFKDGQGHQLYSTESPWGAVTEGSKGFDVKIPFPAAGTLEGTGFQKVTTGGKTEYKYNPDIAATYAADPAHSLTIQSGSGSPHTDFRSPNVAWYSGDEESKKTLANRLSKLDTFAAQVDKETKESLGGTWGVDAQGNTVLMGYDEAGFGRASTQNNGFITNNNSWMTAESAWDKSIDAGKLPAVVTSNEFDTRTSTFSGPMLGIGSAASPLATSQLGDSAFRSLGEHMLAGTLNINPGGNTGHALGMVAQPTIGWGKSTIKTPNYVPPGLSGGAYGPPAPPSGTLTPGIPGATTTPSPLPPEEKWRPPGRGK